MNQRLSIDVNLNVYPTNISPLKPEEQLTLGDLHGNALKFLYILVANGIVEISEVNFTQFKQLYNKSDLNAVDLASFENILQNLKVNKASVRLIGDEFGDRGSNDYFTLKIIKKLLQNDVSMEILISNHGIEFLQAYENYDQRKSFKPVMLQEGGHADSLLALDSLVKKGLVRAEEILEFVEQFYIPNLKIIAYSCNEASKTITIFSHAPIGLSVVQGLATQFGVEYQESSLDELTASIDRINNRFRQHLNSKTVYSSYCPSELMMAAYSSLNGEVDFSNNFFVCAIWNRSYVYMSTSQQQNFNGMQFFFVHGHHPYPAINENVFSLDFENEWGKLPSKLLNGRFDNGKMVLLKSFQQDRLSLVKIDEIAPVLVQHENEFASDINLEALQDLFTMLYTSRLLNPPRLNVTSSIFEIQDGDIDAFLGGNLMPMHHSNENPSSVEGVQIPFLYAMLNSGVLLNSPKCDNVNDTTSIFEIQEEDVNAFLGRKPKPMLHSSENQSLVEGVQIPNNSSEHLSRLGFYSKVAVTVIASSAIDYYFLAAANPVIALAIFATIIALASYAAYQYEMTRTASNKI